MEEEMEDTMDGKVSDKVAEVEFEKFADYWDICTDSDIMTPESKEDFDMRRANIIRFIKSGTVKIDGDGKLTYVLRYPDTSATLAELTFKVPKGDAYIAFDKYRDRQNMAKIYDMLGAMTKLPPKTFSNLDARDVKFCQGMLTLFMAS